MTFTFSDKKEFVRKSRLTLNELRQILHEIEQEEAEFQADHKLSLLDFVFIKKQLKDFFEVRA